MPHKNKTHTTTLEQTKRHAGCQKTNFDTTKKKNTHSHLKLKKKRKIKEKET